MLGGRIFSPVAGPTTFEQDAYLMALLYRHKLHTIVAAGGDVLAALLGSGEAPSFLASVLVEDGQTWSRFSADANAKAFAALTDQEEKAALLGALEGLLAGFFVGEGSSSGRSPTSSRAARKPRATTGRHVPTLPPSSATGLDSSPDSPPTTAPA